MILLVKRTNLTSGNFLRGEVLSYVIWESSYQLKCLASFILVKEGIERHNRKLS